MNFISKSKMEYRRTNTVEGKNGVYYMHSFEDDNASYQFYCKNPVSCKKGDLVTVVVALSVFNGKPQFNMIGVE